MNGNGHVYLCDIASFKPYYLYEDDLDKLRNYFGDF